MTNRARLPHDWSAMSRRQQAEHMDTLARLAGHPALDDAPPAPERAAPVKREAVEQSRLTTMARRAWWGRGYRHIEQATHQRGEARRKSREGVTAGHPDVMTRVPDVGRGVVLLALELKPKTERPRRHVDPGWWLEWGCELARSPESWQLARTEPRRYGLRARQAIELWELSRCGYETMVAYGADEAFAWLDAECGPRPDAMPEGWA